MKKKTVVLSIRVTESMMMAIRGTAEMRGPHENITSIVTSSLLTDLIGVLLTEISPLQINGYGDIPSLYIMYLRASKGVEGYGFTTDDPKTRFVYQEKI